MYFLSLFFCERDLPCIFRQGGSVSSFCSFDHSASGCFLTNSVNCSTYSILFSFIWILLKQCAVILNFCRIGPLEHQLKVARISKVLGILHSLTGGLWSAVCLGSPEKARSHLLWLLDAHQLQHCWCNVVQCRLLYFPEPVLFR